MLFKRVSMNGLVSHLPNERAESGAHHPLAQVKRTVHSTAFGANQSAGGVENGALETGLDDFAVGQTGISPLSGQAPQAPHDNNVGWGVSKNSGLSPSARARTPNADVAARDGAGITKE